MVFNISKEDFVDMFKRANVKEVGEKTVKLLECLAENISCDNHKGYNGTPVGIDLQGRWSTNYRSCSGTFVFGRVHKIWFTGKSTMNVEFQDSHSLSLSKEFNDKKPVKERHLLHVYDGKSDSEPLFRTLTVCNCSVFDLSDVRCIVGDKIIYDSIQAEGMNFRMADSRDEMKLFNLVMKECEGLEIPLPIDRIVKHGNRTKADIISRQGKVKGLPKTLNKYPLPVGLAVGHMIKVMPESYARLLGKKNSEDLMNIFRCSNKSRRSLSSYLETSVAILLYPSIDVHVAETYIRLCLKSKTILDLSLKNEHTMLEKIVCMSKNDSLGKKLSVAKPFKVLSSILGNDYELLDTEERLYLESNIQGNCVRTYAHAVNEGNCAIFSRFVNGQRYTIEVCYDGERGYYCPQFLGKFNTKTDECREQQALFDDILKQVSAMKQKKAENTIRGFDTLTEILSA